MVEVSKTDRDDSGAVVRKFQRQVQQSKILATVRKNRFHTKDKSKREQREEALYKAKVRKEVEKHKKRGTFNDEVLQEIKKRVKDI